MILGGGPLEGCLSGEGEVLTSRISAIYRRLLELPSPFRHAKTQRGDTGYKPGRIQAVLAPRSSTLQPPEL